MTDKLRFGVNVFVGKLYDFYHLSATSRCAVVAAACGKCRNSPFYHSIQQPLSTRSKFISFFFSTLSSFWFFFRRFLSRNDVNVLRFESQIFFWYICISHPWYVPSSIYYRTSGCCWAVLGCSLCVSAWNRSRKVASIVHCCVNVCRRLPMKTNGVERVRRVGASVLHVLCAWIDWMAFRWEHKKRKQKKGKSNWISSAQRHMHTACASVRRME